MKSATPLAGVLLLLLVIVAGVLLTWPRRGDVSGNGAHPPAAPPHNGRPRVVPSDAAGAPGFADVGSDEDEDRNRRGAPDNAKGTGQAADDTRPIVLRTRLVHAETGRLIRDGRLACRMETYQPNGLPAMAIRLPESGFRGTGYACETGVSAARLHDRLKRGFQARLIASADGFARAEFTLTRESAEAWVRGESVDLPLYPARTVRVSMASSTTPEADPELVLVRITWDASTLNERPPVLERKLTRGGTVEFDRVPAGLPLRVQVLAYDHRNYDGEIPSGVEDFHVPVPNHLGLSVMVKVKPAHDGESLEIPVISAGRVPSQGYRCPDGGIRFRVPGPGWGPGSPPGFETLEAPYVLEGPTVASAWSPQTLQGYPWGWSVRLEVSRADAPAVSVTPVPNACLQVQQVRNGEPVQHPRIRLVEPLRGTGYFVPGQWDDIARRPTSNGIREYWLPPGTWTIRYGGHEDLRHVELPAGSLVTLEVPD